MSWPLVKLGDLVTIKGGGTPSKKVDEYWNGDIPWASVKDLKSSEINSTADFITEAGVKNSATNLIPAGTILTATRMALGKFAINSVGMAINQDLKALFINDPSVVERNYLIRFLSSKARYIEGEGKGATVKGITLDFLKDLQVPLPPLEEQKRIAAILDKADSVRRKRQQAIGLADDFLRSVFLDMFGDPFTNSKGWEVKPLKELTLKIGSGSTPRGGKEAYLDQGISLIRSLNVHDNKFVHKDLAFISDVQADKLKNVVIEKDDLLLNITGASVCRATLVDNNILPARVNQHVCIVRAKTEKVLPTFLARLITSSSYKQKLMQIATAGGATREALTKQQVESLDIIVPPLDVQDKFLSIVYRVEKMLKSSELQSQKPLFNSLSQKAFAGEL